MARDPGTILILTGKLCAPRIRSAVAGFLAEVLEVPVQVAALMTMEDVIAALDSVDLSKYRLVLLPGKFRGDAASLEKKFELPFYRGPIHDSDIPLVLTNLEEFQLSPSVPADRLFQEMLRKRVDDAYGAATAMPARQCDLLLGSGARSISLGPGRPPRVIAEVVDAPRKEFGSIIQEATRYVASGASIIDVGMVPGQDNVEFVRTVVPALKRALRTPISVDTMREDEILASADAGCDLVLSICGETLDLAPSLDVPFVVVPVHSPGSDRPRTVGGKLDLLSDFAGRLEGKPMILDPLLEPIGLGFTESIQAYWKLGCEKSEHPTLMGVGNVVEMADVDSVGMNGLLAAVAVETGAGLLLTTENSPKTKGSVSELSTACRMMHYARVKGIPPKDLGVDLLRFKEKVVREYPAALPTRKVWAGVRASSRDSGIAGGIFHIVTRGPNIHLISSIDGKQVDIIGRTSSAIADELQRMGLLPQPRHALYLGSELQKAESAIRTGRSYVQDEPLFATGKDIDEENKD